MREGEFNEEYERYLISILVQDPDILGRAIAVLQPTFFYVENRDIIKYILDTFSKYKIPPRKEELEARFNIKLASFSQGELEAYKEKNLADIETFCRYKASRNAVLTAANLIEKGENLDIERLREAISISIQTDLGLDYLSNPAERLRRLLERNATVSTGWKTVDYDLFGGVNRGELTIFAGNPGQGKSIFLQNIAKNWILMGMNVIYVTLELSAELVAKRLDSMMTGIPNKNIMSNIEQVEAKLNEIRKIHKNIGSLAIKYMPSGTNCNQLYAYLREYMISTGKKVDALLVDYMDLMHPNRSDIPIHDLFIKDKYVSEELRSLAADFGILCITASQLNRSAVGQEHHEMSHISGGISKINTADNVISIISTPSMREKGFVKIQYIKTRNSAGYGKQLQLSYNKETLEITDLHEEMQARGLVSDDKPTLYEADEEEDQDRDGMENAISANMKHALKIIKRISEKRGIKRIQKEGVPAEIQSLGDFENNEDATEQEGEESDNKVSSEQNTQLNIPESIKALKNLNSGGQAESKENCKKSIKDLIKISRSKKRVSTTAD